MGKVYITGAGPGDIELLTIKALRIIRKADVILYDRLINEEILKETKESALLIYVGKEDGKHTIPQNQINELLYEYAMKFNIIVRLKCGDPFVFGRGGEEAIFLSEKGIEYEIIPGITSAISVPAYAGIPVTHRGISSSFRVITGHEDPTKPNSNINWESLKSDETIIFLMGLHNLDKIVNKLLEIGKEPNTPIALIESGTTENQKVLVTTLKEAPYFKNDFNPPTIIVIGEVVNLRDKIKWFSKEKEVITSMY